MSDVTYERISGSLGSLLLLWASIERVTRQEIICASEQPPKLAQGIAAPLLTWVSIVSRPPVAGPLSPLMATTLLEQLREKLKVRNGLCHGLIGISSAGDEEPATLTWETDGSEHHITWEELQASFNWLSKVPRAISVLSTPFSGSSADRTFDSRENREWWLAEFGLALP